MDVGWLYTHLVAANSGITVRTASSIAETARDAVDGVADLSLRARDFTYDGGAAITETTPLLTRTAHAQLDDSIRTFMAMYVSYLGNFQYSLNIKIGNSICK